MERMTARELFDKVAERMALRWVAGQQGENRAIVPAEKQARRPSLVGYLNTIYPNKVQIIGSEELGWLDGLDSRQRWEMIQKVVGFQPTALILTKDQSVPSDLRDAADETGTPIWLSGLRGHELLTYLQYQLARVLARKVTLHGVLMEVYSIGVLITGESGSGKSELALELITRGHRLVADDAPELAQIAPDVIDGSCPEMLQDLLEVRGLGILNVREMFGHTAVKPSKYLRLIVHLQTTPRADNAEDGLERIYGDNSYREVLDTKIPQTTIPVAPGRNLAVLIEVAVRNHVLKSKGIDPAQTFLDRQAHQMQRQAPW
ncbi:MAG TPA: HPr(Ser) kinase/phosphatase [Rudaea sp.]|nr:HPr(Ser) kinase/phosphatase [Rudaea sp.]